MLLPDCIWVWIFSTTSPSWMMSCVTLIPVISANALARTLDSYSCVVRVSDTTLMSMPTKGFAALMNHSISFICSSLDSVEGWNSESTHFLASSIPANAGHASTMARQLAPAARVIFLSVGDIVVPPLAFQCFRGSDGAVFSWSWALAHTQRNTAAA